MAERKQKKKTEEKILAVWRDEPRKGEGNELGSAQRKTEEKKKGGGGAIVH